MARKKRSKDPRPSDPGRKQAPCADEGTSVSPLVLAFALALVLAGYFFLRRTGPDGRDLNAVLSAIFLLSGYLLVPGALLLSRRSCSPTGK